MVQSSGWCVDTGYIDFHRVPHIFGAVDIRSPHWLGFFKRVEVMSFFPVECSLDTSFLLAALSNKPNPHGINMATTHGVRYTTHRTPHLDRMFGERGAGYRTRRQEKDGLGGLNGGQALRGTGERVAGRPQLQLQHVVQTKQHNAPHTTQET